jgi:phosphoenolpyruvate carboxykinase (ATP)
MGEIIEVDKATGKKKLVRKVTRVPIDLMAALQRGDLRGTNEYTKGRLGTEYVVKAEGTELSQYDAHTYYSDE